MNLKRRFKVYYRKEPRFHLDNDLTREQVVGNGTHTFLKDVVTDSVENVYWEMQGENWSPRGEARPLIEALGLHHTSMSVGDCVLDVEGDVLWQVANAGWQEVKS